MVTSTYFLSDSSQVTSVTPSPYAGTSFFTHIHSPTGAAYSKWSVLLASGIPAPPSMTTDTLTITDAQTHDGTPHPDAVFVLYATLCWYFHLPARGWRHVGRRVRGRWCVRGLWCRG